MDTKDQSTPPAFTPPTGMGTAQPQAPQPPAPTVMILKTPGAFVAKLLAVVLGIALLVSLIANMVSFAAFSEYFQTDTNITEKFHSGEKYASDKIAIIKVSGVMMEGEGFTKRQIDRVRDDDNVKAIVLRVDSPGGAVTAADYMYHHLVELKKEKQIPLVVSMGSMAASGGYYVAMAVGDEEKAIYAEPTTITGSIGVIIPRYDVSKLLSKYDVESDSIVSHPHKELGSWMKEMSPEERKKLQDQVNLLFARFKDIIKQGRPMFQKDEDALNQVATGEVFTGEQAKDLMLVDEVGFIEDAIKRAADLADLGKDDYRVVEYQSPATLADALGVSIQTPQHPLDTRALLELATPRAYYLYSWLPPLSAQ
jgi:protease-4